MWLYRHDILRASRPTLLHEHNPTSMQPKLLSQVLRRQQLKNEMWLSMSSRVQLGDISANYKLV